MHTHVCTHKKAKAKPLAAGHVFLDKPGHLCIKQVRCAMCYEHSWSPGSSQEVPTMPPTAGVGTLCPTTTISGTMRHSRYPFYRWVGWNTGDLFVVFSSSCSTSVLWVINPGLYQLNHQGTHTNTQLVSHHVCVMVG